RRGVDDDQPGQGDGRGRGPQRGQPGRGLTLGGGDRQGQQEGAHQDGETEPHGDHLGGVLEAAEEGGGGPNASHLAVRLPRRGFPADPRNDSRSEIPEHPGPAGPWSVHVTGLPGTCQKGWVVSFGMSWQRKLNKALVRFTGFQVNRVGNKGIAAASTAPVKAASTKAKA